MEIVSIYVEIASGVVPEYSTDTAITIFVSVINSEVLISHAITLAVAGMLVKGNDSRLLMVKRLVPRSIMERN